MGAASQEIRAAGRERKRHSPEQRRSADFFITHDPVRRGQGRAFLVLLSVEINPRLKRGKKKALAKEKKPPMV